MAKNQNKTQPNATDVTTFLASVEPEERRQDCFAVLEMMQDVTGKEPVMWGDSIVGFDKYHYKYDSGREGDFFRVGFSPRKQNLTLYIMPGYQDFGSLLKKLGPHKLGKSCLYLKHLSEVDLGVLRELIQAGYNKMTELYGPSK